MNKKIILFLIILVSIFTVSHAWAADDMETQIEAEIDDASSIELNDGDNQVLTDNAVQVIYPNCTDIQGVIDSANESDTICFDGTFEFKNTIKINKTLAITGINNATIKKSSWTADVFPFFNIESSNVVLSNITFLNSQGSAVILQGDNGVITNCQFENNLNKLNGCIGGAIALKGSNCNVTDCVFAKNLGGTTYGGAVYVEGSNNLIARCDFSNNEASEGGGAIYSNAESLAIDYCNFTGNKANDRGGAILVGKTNNKIRYSTFNSNKVLPSEGNATGGGAIYSMGSLTIDTCNFNENNASKSNGGAVVLSDSDTVKFSSFKLNSAVLGNDIYTAKDPTVTSNNFTIHYPIAQSVCGISESVLKNLNNKFDIIKDKSDITFSAGISFEYGSTSQPILVTVKGGTVSKDNIMVLNHPEAKITFSNNVLTISNLDVGKYTLRVTTTPDENHLSVDSDLQITVKKATAAIQASKVTVALKKGTLWTIKLIYSKTGKAIPNMKLTLKVYTGKNYKTVSVKTNSKGIASYQTKKLAKGAHKVIVKGSDSRYNFNTLQSSIKVIKQKPIKFKVTRKTGTDGATLSIHVMDKKTKKPINGVKVKLQIYTGKKYKIITLKTKKIKGYHGVCGYSTNKLSIGKHKVKILPNTIKYSGSALSSMKITKSAKKHNPWESRESA